jgi:predicted transcriptional regulator
MKKNKHGKRKKRSEIKTILLLLIIQREGPVGRYRLKEMLDLSHREGLVRLMLTDLKDAGYLKTSKAGSELTGIGHEHINNIFKTNNILTIKELNLEPFKIKPNSFIIHLQNRPIPQPIVELRDIAVKAGASGAIILLFKKGRLIMPTVYSDLSLDHPELAHIFLNNFNLSEEDVLIICFSKNRWRALEGCLAVTLYLSQ